TIGTSLTRMEIWIESRLDQWINRSEIFLLETNRLESLLNFFEDYQNAALNHYWSDKGPTDPIGYSRFILTSLTIIRTVHQKLCKDQRFERLKQHSINIPNLMKLFEVLIIPNREDMIRVSNLKDYFSEFTHKKYPDLLSSIDNVDAFGVYYASQSPQMNESIQKIRVQAEFDKQQNIQEYKSARERYSKLMNSIKGLPCTCTYKHGYYQTCHSCCTRKQAENIRVHIYECPLPKNRESALAVIFELQMPIEIRYYRDIIWQFVNRPNPNPKHKMHEWLSSSPHRQKLGPYFIGPSCYTVKLVSAHKSVTETDYSSPPSVATASIEAFLFENSLIVEILPTQPIKLPEERCILTPQLDHPDYKQLQFTIDTTQFVQNNVIANLSNCSARLKLNQFIEFGSFRSGHRLQWWNLLALFEMDSLPIYEESVIILITHSILQCGPWTTYGISSSNSWCSEAHEYLLEDHFIDELIIRLDRRLDDCELNWQNELVLVTITMITMRMLTICNSIRQDKVTDLVIKCRRIGERWISLISENIKTSSPSAFDKIDQLRMKIVIIGISCIITFSTHSDRLHYLLSSTEHIVSLLKSATTIHDNVILNTNKSSISTYIRNIMRYSEHVLVRVQPTVAELLQKSSCQALNDFAAIYWAPLRSKSTMNGKWKKRRHDPSDGWYDCRYESRYISIDCIQGIFLVDGMSIGFLPENITTNELFIRVFRNHIFEVQLAESPKTYITKHLYHDNGRVQYEFYFNDETKCLRIIERHIHTNEKFQLITH
ncbi:unnamed protein product, partial [Rotaria sp. Silwood2]